MDPKKLPVELAVAEQQDYAFEDVTSLTQTLGSLSLAGQKILNQKPEILEELVQTLVPKQDEQYEKLQNYTSQITELCKQTGIEIASLAYPLDYNPLELKQDHVSAEEQTPTEPVDINAFQKAINEDRQKAKDLISQMVARAKTLKQNLLNDIASKPIHPYEQMIHEYLGKEFKPKPVEEMQIEPNLNLFEILAEITEMSKDLQEKAMLQVQHIARQAMDTSFPGITSEALASAFAVLKNGEFVIDHEMTKRHLEFVENIRSLSVDYVIKYPYAAAKRILSEFKRVNYSFAANPKQTLSLHALENN